MGTVTCQFLLYVSKKTMNLQLLVVVIVNVLLCLRVNLPVVETQVYMYLFEIKK